jgi:hypothetical protein
MKHNIFTGETKGKKLVKDIEREYKKVYNIEDKKPLTLLEIFDYSLFLVMFILFIPFLFFSGGIRRIVRWYKYVKSNVKGETPKTYKY